MKLILLVVGTACSDEEQKPDKADPETIYFDYQVRGHEESGLMTIRLQFRNGGPGRPGLPLDDSYRVEFDGEPLQADSSRRTGAWFELHRGVDEMEGSHAILFTDNRSRHYLDSFEFRPVAFREKFPAVIKRDDLVFHLEGIREGTRVILLLTDTAFYSRDIDRIDTIRDGRILISKQELNDLSNGPVNFELYCDEVIPLGNGRSARGRILVSYGLRRVFELRD